MTDREVMQQALEALEAKGDAWIVLERKAIISLRAALAETTQEPHDYRFRYDKSCYKCKSMYCPADCKDTALEQQAEPVAWQYKTVEAGIFVSDQLPQDVQVWQDIEWSIPLYTTPPQQQAEPPTCAWSPEDDDFMPGTYRSACGELWSYVDGGWKDNRVNFCHGCGGKVVEAANNIQEPKS